MMKQGCYNEWQKESMKYAKMMWCKNFFPFLTADF